MAYDTVSVSGRDMRNDTWSLRPSLFGLKGFGETELTAGCRAATVKFAPAVGPLHGFPLVLHSCTDIEWAPSVSGPTNTYEYGAVASKPTRPPSILNSRPPPGAVAWSVTLSPTVAPSAGAVTTGASLSTVTVTPADFVVLHPISLQSAAVHVCEPAFASPQVGQVVDAVPPRPRPANRTPPCRDRTGRSVRWRSPRRSRPRRRARPPAR